MYKIYIKNMVCSRCKMVVKSIFEQLELFPLAVELGEITLENPINSVLFQPLKKNLEQLGFEILDDKKKQLVEKIKNTLIEWIHHSTSFQSIKLSDYLCQKIPQDYAYLSHLFSQTESITIEQYFILQKIEKVKELLMYDEWSLSQIADKLGYSSVAHLSGQFKKTTGLTPTFYKKIKENKRKNIEEL